MRKTAASWFAGSLFILGLADLILRCHLTNFSDSLRLALHDPGKTLFHLVLLPSATYTILRHYPIDVVRYAISLQAKRRTLFAWATLFLVLALSLGAYDLFAGFQDRQPMPEDVAKESDRGVLLATRIAFLQPNADGKALSTTYRSEVQSRLADRPLSKASARVYLSSLLTTTALLLLALVFWTLAAHSVAGHPLGHSQDFLTGLVIGLAVLSPWLLLRPYSEWHFNFGAFAPGDYEPLWLALLFGALVAALIVILKEKRDVTVLVSAVVTAGSMVFAIATALEPALLGKIAAVAMSSAAIYLVAAYVIVGGAIGIAVTFASAGQT